MGTGLESQLQTPWERHAILKSETSASSSASAGCSSGIDIGLVGSETVARIHTATQHVRHTFKAEEPGDGDGQEGWLRAW